MADVPNDDKEPEKTVVHVQPVSSHNIGQRLLPNCALSAKFQPKHEEQTAVVTVSNKILIDNDEHTLHMKDKIRCIASVRFAEVPYDFIVVGTESQVIMYDIHNNITLFTRDIPDGVKCFAVGKLANRETMIYCGGNCAIWGFDRNGLDAYWTVTGDSVTTMCLVDYDADGENELIIGSPDSEIRVFKDDLMRREIMETDAVLRLAPVSSDSFAYSLANGTLGVYKKDDRLWRIKSKHLVIDILDFPSTPGQFSSVWDNGKKDIRNIETGDQLASFTHEAQIVSAFVRNTPEGQHLITASIDGTLDGYAVEGRTEKIDKTQETLREFGQQKHNLLMELSNFEAEEAMKEADKKKDLRIPANTTVDCSKEVKMEERTLYLKLKASNDVAIRAVIAFAEGMFAGDSYIWVPSKVQGTGDELFLPLLCEKDHDCEISLRAFLGHLDADRLFIFECFVQIPKFARFFWLNNAPENPIFQFPKNYVECNLKIRLQRVVDWVNESFTTITELNPEIDKETRQFDFNFIELAPKKTLSLVIRADLDEEKLSIFCECMETAGDLLQSFCQYVSIATVHSIAHYPEYFEEVEKIIAEMDDMYDVETRLTTDLSSQTSAVKEIIVRAEDALFLQDMDSTKRYYNRLKIADTAMRQAYLLRHNHHEGMVKKLRRLNKIIEFAAKLRVGVPGRDIVATCRDAIREDNKEIIVKILQYGAKSE